MASQNNAHIPHELLTAVNAAAQAEGKTADDLLAEAARRYQEHKELDELVEHGRGAGGGRGAGLRPRPLETSGAVGEAGHIR